MKNRAADNDMAVMGTVLHVDAERQDAAPPMIDEMLAEMRQLRREVALDQRLGFAIAHGGSISYRPLVSSTNKPGRSMSGNFNAPCDMVAA